MLKRLVILACATAILCSPAAYSQQANSGNPWWSGLEIGVRSLHVWLSEDTRNGVLNPGADPTHPTSYSGRFLGTINKLDVQQEYMPTRVYAQYFFRDNIGVGVLYDETDIDTKDEAGSDGYINLHGAIVYAVARMTVEERITPFAELGLGIYSTDFEPVESWRKAGPRGRRVMDIDDPLAGVIGLGVDIALNQHFAFNVYTRAVFNATVDAKAYYSKDPDEPFARGEFPLNSFGVGIGLKYAF